jgi:hypothetical protein
LDGQGRIPPMLIGVLIALWRARRWAAVHPASAVSHRGRLAGSYPLTPRCMNMSR